MSVCAMACHSPAMLAVCNGRRHSTDSIPATEAPRNTLRKSASTDSLKPRDPLSASMALAPNSSVDAM